MTPLEALQAKLIQELQANIEVLQEENLGLNEALNALSRAYADLQIKKAHDA